VPVDVTAAEGATAPARQLVPLMNGRSGVVDRMARRRAELGVAIIDASRDNPLGTWPPDLKPVGVPVGLVRPAPPPAGTFVLFSAGPGERTLDGLTADDSDKQSLFARVLARNLGLFVTLDDVAKETEREVFLKAKSAGARQQPFYQNQVTGAACLSQGCALPSEAQIEKLAKSIPKFTGSIATTDLNNGVFIQFLENNRDKIVFLDLTVSQAFITKANYSVHERCNSQSYDLEDLLAKRLDLPTWADGEHPADAMPSREEDIDCLHSLVLLPLHEHFEVTHSGTGLWAAPLRGFFEVTFGSPGSGTEYELKEWDAPLAVRVEMLETAAGLPAE